ncbi:MAG TPA: hypothetical protein VK524_12155 [Polyangiaceae bacterium]|nr:hypothetical protein [Polyangiaceae bacterium]
MHALKSSKLSTPETLSRRSCAAALALLVLTRAPQAWAGSYLDRAALLIAQATRESDYLRARLGDRELCQLVHDLASSRVRAAGGMTVPKEVAQAHPHLLLVLENYERAAASAVDGRAQKFLVYQVRARDEERVLRGVLKQLGWSLPESGSQR